MLSLHSSVPVLFECMDGDQWVKSEVWKGALAKDAECRQYIEGLTNCVAVRDDTSSPYARRYGDLLDVFAVCCDFVHDRLSCSDLDMVR